MKKKVRLNEFVAARDFVRNCCELYPEEDMIDEYLSDELSKCLTVIERFRKQSKPLSKTSPKKSKLEIFENAVTECLRQGYGEERQLYEEATSRRNPHLRRKLLSVYNNAVLRYKSK